MPKTSRWIVVSALALSATSACSSSTSDPPATAADTGASPDTAIADLGTTPDGAATPDTPASETAPTDLCAMMPANGAAEITDTVDGTPFPGASATGGAIESGTYEEIAHVYHQPTTTPTHKWKGTMAMDATAGTSIANISRDGAVFQQTGAKYTTSGNKITLAFTCPAAVAGMNVTLSYSYAAGKLTIYTDADKTATVFQKK